MKKKIVVYLLLTSMIFSQFSSNLVFASSMETSSPESSIGEERKEEDTQKDTENKDSSNTENKEEKEDTSSGNETKDEIKEEQKEEKQDESNESKDDSKDVKEDTKDTSKEEIKDELKDENKDSSKDALDVKEEGTKEEIKEDIKDEVKEEKVTISFYVDEEVFDSVEIVKGAKVESSINNPSKDYMDFKGWFNGDEEFNFYTTFDKDASFKAKFEETKYSITYEFDGGSASNLPDSYTYFDEDISIPNLTKDDYIFEGWDIDGKDVKDYVIKHNSSGDITLKASFSLNYGLYDNDGHLVKSFKTLVNEGYFVIDENVLSRGDNEYFEDLEGMIKIPDEIVKISANTFEKAKFNKIVLSNNLEEIEDNAFKDASNLEELILPEEVKSIGSNFIEGTNIESIYIDKNVNTILDNAFNSNSLKEIVVSEDNDNFLSEDGVLYSKDKSVLIKYPENMDYKTTFNISTSCRVLDNAFRNANIKRININAKNVTLNENSLNSGNIEEIRILDWTILSFKDNSINKNTKIYYTGNDENVLNLVNTPVYKITYNLDGGSASNKEIFNELDDFTLNIPEKDGYTFLYWELNGENVGKYFNVRNLSEDITLKAVYELSESIPYKVIHKKQTLDGEYEEFEVETFKGKMGDKVSPEVKEYEGFTSPEIQTATILGDGSLVVEYLYDRNSYKINVTTDDNIILANFNETYLYDEDITIGLFFRDGYEVDKVYGDFNKLSFKMPAKDITLNITSKLSTYTITYDLDGGHLKAGASNRTSYTVEDDGFIISNPEKDGQEFIGWVVNNNSEIIKTLMITKGTTGNLNIKAIFSDRKYTILFDASGAEGEMDKIEVNYTDTIKLPENKFTKHGYKFSYWKVGNKTYTDMQEVSKLTLDKEIVLEAYFEPIVYTITYGTIEDKGENKSVYTVEDDDYILINPEMEGYKFLGWTGSNGLIPQEKVTIYKGETGDKNYIANWEKLSIQKGITIIWNDDGDESLRPESYILYLYRNGELYKTITVSSKDFEFNLDELEKYDENGNKYVYTWKTEVSGRYRTNINEDGSITFSKQETSYSINIPKHIVLDTEGGVSKYEISVEGTSYLNDSLDIIPSESIQMSSDGKEDIFLPITQDIKKIVQKENKDTNYSDDSSVAAFDEDGRALITGQIDTSAATAGTWDGSIKFTIIHTEQN